MTVGILADIIPTIPLAQWVTNFVDWVTNAFAGPFDVVKAVLGAFVTAIQTILTGPPELVVVAVLTALAWLLAGWRVALFTAIGLLFTISLGLWQDAMVSLSLVIAATIVSLIIGIPVGVLAARSAHVEAATKPILDVMQTMPSFVYLIPMAILLGLGNVPALVATVVFAMPPAIRLTMLGIQQVPRETVEAAHAFGATPGQTLIKVVLALSMVVIAALIGGGGLGLVVVTGLSQLDVGKGFVGGLAIVIIAMILDRVTRNVTTRNTKGVRRVIRLKRAAAPEAPAGY